MVSIIVPVYQVEDYLERCVESLLRQTYGNIEIILVDDGSADHSPQICDAYAASDNSIQVIHKENGGLSDARNAGIEAAKGDYLCFVDSDDYIAETMVGDLVHAAETDQVKMVITNIKTMDEAGNEIEETQENPIHDGIFCREELIPKVYRTLGWYYIVAWNKLYHRSLFETIRFPKGKLCEDEFVVTQLMWEAGNITCISKREYCYTVKRSGSITAGQSGRRQCDWLEALWERFVFCGGKETLLEFRDETRAVYFRELNHLYLQVELREGVSDEKRREAKKRYAQMGGKRLTEKVNWLLFQISPALEDAAVRLVRQKTSRG